MVHISKTTKLDDFGPRELFIQVEKIYQMIPISVHLSKVENTGPNWSGPVVQAVRKSGPSYKN